MMYKIVSDFISTHLQLIDYEKWEEVYQQCIGSIRGYFTQALNEAEIHPELYMKQIPEYFCYKREDITTYEINKHCTQIDNCAFYYAKNLEEIQLPDSIENIGRNAFANCNLKKVILPANLKILKLNVFGWNNNLEEVVINQNIKQILNHPFIECGNLKKVRYLGTVNEFHQISKTKDWGELEGLSKCITSVECVDGLWEI